MATFKLKQKEYALPLLAALGGAGNLLSTAAMTVPAVIGNNTMKKQGEEQMMMQAKQNKIMNQQAEVAAKEQQRHNMAMEAAAKNGVSNPAAFNLDSGQREFALTKVLNKAREAVSRNKYGGLASDFYQSQKGNIKSALKTGATFAGFGYLGNRIVTSMRDHDEGRDDENKSFLKKAAIAAGTVGSGIYAARKGWLGKGTQKFMKEGYGGRALRAANEAFNPIAKDENGKISLGKSALKLGGNAFFLGMPVVSYLRAKKEKKRMANNTAEENQKDYSTSYDIPRLKMFGWIEGIKGTLKTLRSKPGQTLSSGASKLSSFFKFYGKGGTEAVQNTGKKLVELGKKRDAKYGGKSLTSKLGEWITKKDAKGNLVNATKANLAATAGTLAFGGLAYKAGDAIVSKPARAFDKAAYAREDEENQLV